MNYTAERPGRVLETLPGAVHGIVGQHPYKIQCDGCLVVHSGNTRLGGGQIILAGIWFNPRRYDSGDKRRLCADCRKKEWGE